jgi:ABC-type lipoprotein release transport system permease subunit
MARRRGTTLAPVWAWLHVDLRRRWRALTVLSLLVAVSTGTVLTAVAGARRTDSVVQRLRAATEPADVDVFLAVSPFDWDVVRALPQVVGLATYASTGFALEGVASGRVVAPYAFDAAALYDVERPVVLAGRLPDPDRVDEAVVTPGFAAAFGLGVGARVTARLWRPEDLDTAFTLTHIPAPDGPTVPMTIVGTIRSNLFSDTTSDIGVVVASPALLATYRVNLIGHEVFPTGALVRLRGGPAAFPAFQAALAEATGRSDISVISLAELGRQPQQAARFEAICLLAFALAALAAALVVVGQSLIRQVWAAAPDLQVLRSLGMTPREGVLASCAGPALAGVLGIGLGAAAAVIASASMPFGTAALVEPAPGISIDPAVLATGSLLAGLAIIGTAAATAHLALTMPWHPSGSPGSPTRHRSLIIAALRGMPLPLLTGARFAVERGRGPTALPVRPALLGAVTGVLGVMAAATVLAGGQDAARTPSRFGQTHHLTFTVGYNGHDFLPAHQALAALATDPDVAGTNNSVISVVASCDIRLPAYRYEPVGRPIPTVMLSGRMPSGEREVAVAPTTARTLGVRIGDAVRLAGPDRAATYTVTGIGFVPASWRDTYDVGVWLTPSGSAAVSDGFEFHLGMISLRPGVNREAVRPRLAALAGRAIGGDPVQMDLPPLVAQVSQLRRVLVLPLLLGIFLVVLGLGAVGHALATAGRRRRLELAVLRALGLTRRQTRLVFATQATVLTTVGLTFGIPLGIALGRTAWRAVGDYLPLQYQAPGAVWTTLIVVPAAVAGANLLATWPAHRAVRRRPADVLGAE